jgi:hypothetical protein
MLSRSDLGLDWMNSNGGPLLLVPGEYLTLWEGIEPPSAGRRVQATFRWDDPAAPATDYDRACDVQGYLGAIRIGDGTGLVLGDEPTATAWWPVGPDTGGGPAAAGGMLVRSIYADSEAHILEVLSPIREVDWAEDGITFHVGQQPVYLIDAAFAGSELEGDDHLTIQLPVGSYTVATAVYEPDSATSLVLHRLVPSE